MTDAGDVFIDVRFDVPKITRDLGKSVSDAADKAAKQGSATFADRLAANSGKLKDAGKKMTLGVTLPVIGGLTLATKAASDLQQAVGGTGAVFGAQRGKIDAFAKSAAQVVGLSEEAARSLTSQLGGALKGYGFSVDEAADKSQQLVTLGADLAATFGGSTQDAVLALSAALRGEFDPLERYAVAINQTLINQKAVDLNLAQSTGNVSQHAKAQAALALIMERTTDAQGQFNEELNTEAGRRARATAEAENAAASMGKNLLPVATKASEVVGGLASAFASLPSSAQTAAIGVGVLAAVVGPVLSGLGKVGEAIEKVRERSAKKPSPDAVKGIGESADGSTGRVGRLGQALGGLGIVVAGLTAAWTIWNKAMADAEAEGAKALDEGLKGRLEAVVAGTSSFGDAITDIERELQGIDADIGQRQNPLDPRDYFDIDHVRQLQTFRGQVESTQDTVGKFHSQAARLAPQIGKTAQETEQWLAKQALAGVTFKDSEAALAAYRKEQEQTGEATDALARQTGGLTQAAEEFSGGLFGAIDAEKAYRNAVDAITEAEKARDQAARGVTDAQRAYVDSQEAVADAQRQVEDAHRGVDDAVRGVADAERGLEDAHRGVVDAERARTDALAELEDAQEAVAEAQRALDEALAGPSRQDSIDIEQAEIRLRDLEKRLRTTRFDSPDDRRSAELELEEARLELARLRAEVAGRPGEAAEALAEAQRREQEARLGVDAANRGVTDAYRQVEDAARGVETAKLAVVEADRKVVEAHNGVRDAQYAERDAAQAVKDAQDDYREAVEAIPEKVEDAAMAAYDLKIKQDAVAASYRDSSAGAQEFLTYLERMKTEYPQYAAVFEDVARRIREAMPPAAPDGGGQAPGPGPTPPGSPGPPGPGSGGPWPPPLPPPGPGQETYDSYSTIARILGHNPSDEVQAAVEIVRDSQRSGGPSDILGAVRFFGFRKLGGAVGGGGAYQVGEGNRPELYREAGRQYLIPGDRGEVVPLGAAGGPQVVVNVSSKAPAGEVARIVERRIQRHLPVRQHP